MTRSKRRTENLLSGFTPTNRLVMPKSSRKIQGAYDILSDPEKRQNFDRFGTAEGPQQGGGNPFDMFSQMFGGGGGGFGGGNPFGFSPASPWPCSPFQCRSRITRLVRRVVPRDNTQPSSHARKSLFHVSHQVSPVSRPRRHAHTNGPHDDASDRVGRVRVRVGFRGGVGRVKAVAKGNHSI
jgi:curved DNA-binding protein CbpA